MKQKILILFFILAAVSILMSCGGGDGSSTNTPPPISSGDSGGNDSGNSKEDMGQLPSVDADENDTENILNLQAIEYKDIDLELDELKVCTDTSCWTVLANNSQSKAGFANKRSSKLTDRTTLKDIGRYDLGGIEGQINSIEYLYNGKVGQTPLKAPIKTDQDLQKDLYLDLAEVLSMPFSSLSIENGQNGVFIPDENFTKEFINGVIVEIQNGSAEEMANLYIKKIGELVDENAEANIYLIKFYALDHNFEDLRELKNKFPKEFQNEITVYLPINFTSSISEDYYTNYMKANHVLRVNNSPVDYEVVIKNNQNYIVFTTRSTTIKVLFSEK